MTHYIRYIHGRYTVDIRYIHGTYTVDKPTFVMVLDYVFKRISLLCTYFAHITIIS